MDSDSIWVVFEIISYIVAFIMIILSIYCTLQLRLYHNEMFMKKRSLSISYGFIISFLIVIISLPVSQYTVLNLSLNASITPTIIVFTSTWFYLYFLILKNWMIYYRYHFTYYTMESQWMQLINSNLSSESNWFIRNHSKYGNLSYVYKVIAIPCIIGGIIILASAIATVIFISQGNTLGFCIGIGCIGMVLIPPILCYVMIVRKTPSYDDTFYIHWESKRHAKILLWFMNINTLVDIAMIVIDIRFTIIGLTAAYILFSAIIYTSTVQIINKNTMEIPSASPKESGNCDSPVITLSKVLSNQDGIHRFITHLSKEYSIECLLALIEIVQFKKYIENISVDSNGFEKETGEKYTTEIIFPSTIPASEIMEREESVSSDIDTEDKDVHIAKIKAHRLYNKYIKTGSEFEVNIGASQREKLINILQDLKRLHSFNMTMKDLYSLFDECKQEMINLLTFSLARFKQTPEYANVLSCFSV